MKNYVNYSGFIDIVRTFRRGDEVSYARPKAKKAGKLSGTEGSSNKFRYPPYLLVPSKSIKQTPGK